MTRMEVAICPRCGKRPLRRVIEGREIPGALSRVDSATEICSACGNDEAMVGLFEKRPAQPLAEWPVATPYGDEYEKQVVR